MTEPEARPAAFLDRIPGFGAAQRAIESIVIAVVTSTGLYLVGSVYVESYFGRMSIEATSLDLSPPYIALQAAHVVQSLIEYPLTLLGFWVIYRLLASRIDSLHRWYDRFHSRFGRLFLLIVNLAVVSPLLSAALRATIDQGMYFPSTLIGEVGELMTTFGTLLLIYVIWLSVGPRSLILTQIRQHKLVPIVLLFVLYLLDALVATADGAAVDAEATMTGAAESSIEITFTLSPGVEATLPETPLILAIARGGNYYVVERQPAPPSRRPLSYIVPFDSVELARTQRVNPAGPRIEDFILEDDLFGTPLVPSP